MCTALRITAKDCYFGRNLDIDCSYGEKVCIVPRNFGFKFRKAGEYRKHHAIIGMAAVVDGTPLFYDAVNEYGLSVAGLNFPDNAFYLPESAGKENVAPFELIPWILGRCKSVAEARALMKTVNIADIAFSTELPPSPLHWIISDRNESIVAEPMKSGLHIHNNPTGILTNNPPFEQQMFNLNNYRHLSADNGKNLFLPELPLDAYCQGLGALGLPGDNSSMSRFVRLAFYAANSVCNDDEASAVNQFFHLLSAVRMCRGSCRTDAGGYDITVYSSCVNTKKGLYYYTTYDNHQIRCVNMHHTDLESDKIASFPIFQKENICYMN